MGDVLLANIPFSGHFLTIVKRGHIAALLTLKAKWFDTLTGEIKITTMMCYCFLRMKNEKDVTSG